MADSHGGNRLGLLNPATTLEMEDEAGQLVPWTPSRTEVARYLWDLYVLDLDNCIALADGDEITVLHVGDVTQGKRYADAWVSTRMADQFVIAEDNLAPWFEYENVKVVRLIKGTGSHVFGEGSGEILVARALQQRFPDRDVKAMYHGWLDVAGVRVDAAHHGPGPGIRDWTSGNQMRYYMKSLADTEYKRGRWPPRLVLRAHYHTWKRETVRDTLGGEPWQGDIMLVPSYCGMGDYARRATRSAWVQVHGLVAFEIAYGKLIEVHPFVHELDLRTEEVV